MPLEWFTLILVTVWGACVGSFLNVVIYRLPAGISVVSPPSRCPGCETKLAAYDNVPVLGWLWLRGRCRTCRMKISVQYPLVEAATAGLFGGLTWVYYFTDLREVFADAGIGLTWPVLAVHLVLVACMVAATMIDAKLYIIPLSLPWLASAVAMVGLPLAVGVGWVPASLLELAEGGKAWDQLVPYVNKPATCAAVGGAIGLCLSVLLLRLKVLPLSFDQEVELPEGADPDDPNLILVHPHPRREMGKELLFVAGPLLGALIGYAVGGGRAESQVLFADAPFFHVLGGVLTGYLVGGGIVWATRILGTLGFGKEAMGLGDVHLMAAVGAVIGWRDVILAFFIAPFFGIIAAVLMAGVAALVKGKVRVIPYGPYLCAAAVVVMVWRTTIWQALFIRS